MTGKRIFGILLVLVGIGMIFASVYIMGQVTQGREQISEAQEKVNKGKSLFNLNPITKEIGKGLTGSAEKKIEEGRQTADKYEELASWLKIVGIVFVVLGGLGILFGKKKQ